MAGDITVTQIDLTSAFACAPAGTRLSDLTAAVNAQTRSRYAYALSGKPFDSGVGGMNLPNPHPCDDPQKRIGGIPALAF